jgi:ABC-2 type transport system permease protein
MRLFLHELRGQLVLYTRSKELAFFTFLLPLILFVLLGSTYGNDTINGDRGADFLEAGMLGYGLVSTAFAGLAIFMVIRRESGILKRVRATPLPAWVYLSAVLASTLIAFAANSICMIAIGRGLFSVPLPDRWLSLVLTLVLGAFAFAALGLAMTVIVHSAEGASASVNAVYLPMAFISGSFFSPHSFPQFLRAIAAVLPLTYFIHLTRDVMLHGQQFWDNWGDVGVIAAWGAVGAIVAIWRFRWEPAER